MRITNSRLCYPGGYFLAVCIEKTISIFHSFPIENDNMETKGICGESGILGGSHGGSKSEKKKKKSDF